MPTVVILVRTVNNTSDAKRAFLGPCRIVRRRCKFTCDVRTVRTSQDKSTYVGLGVASRAPALYRKAALAERRLAERQTERMSTLTPPAQEAYMDRLALCNRRPSEDSSASRLDAEEQSRRTRLNHRRRSVGRVGGARVDVDDGIITVVIRTARANACPIRSCAHRHCAVIAYSRATAR